MGRKRMGYEGLIYYGVKGSTAATQILNCVDVNYETTPTTGSTKKRGDGSAPPIKTGEATGIEAKMSFNMIVDDDDTVLVALLAAAATGAAVALRYIRSSGKLGLDADCIISQKQGAPLEGEQTVDFEVLELSDSDRAPLLNA